MKQFKLIFSILTVLAFTPCNANKPLSNNVNQKLLSLERATNGRIGVYAIDLGNHVHIHYHSEQRFPLCSTAKVMAVGAILKKSMNEPGLLNKNIRYQPYDLANYSPETRHHLIDGIKVSALCRAAITQSDNTAMNLLIHELGGVKTVTQFAHSIGDKTYNLVRSEPALNSAIPGDLRDTSTPIAEAESLKQLLYGKKLGVKERNQLKNWLADNRTGEKRIRAVVPKKWMVGDKTGTGKYGATSDLGFIQPPGCQPIIIAIYFAQLHPYDSPRDDVIASATKIVLNEFAKKDKCFLRPNR